MNIFQYIAESSPYESKAILSKYGYSLEGVETYDQLSQAMEDMCASGNGEQAFKEFAALHPDKEMIVQLFGTTAGSEHAHDDCECKKGKDKNVIDKYVGKTSNLFSNHQTNVLFALAGIFIIGALAFTNSKK